MDNYENNDVLSQLIKTLKDQNTRLEQVQSSVTDLGERYNYANNLTNPHLKTIHQTQVNATNTTTNRDAYQITPHYSGTVEDNLEKFEKIVKVTSKIWDAASLSIDKLHKQFDKLSTSVESTADSIGQKKSSRSRLKFDESGSLLEKKGFRAAIRRGIVDINGQSKQKGVKESIGRLFGQTLSFAGGVPMSHRKAYAREFLHPELEYKRAISGTEKERSSILPHETEILEDTRRNIRKGKIDTKHLTEDEYLDNMKKKIVAKANLKAVRAKDVKYRPDLQKQWEIDSGDLEEYNSKKIIERAKKKDLTLSKSEKQEHIAPLKKDLIEGRHNTFGISHADYIAQEEKLVALRNNLKALEHNLPELGNEKGGVKDDYKAQIQEILKQRDTEKRNYYGDKKEISVADRLPKLKTDIHNVRDKLLLTKKDAPTTQSSLGSTMKSFITPKEMSINELKISKLSIDEMGATTFTVETLNLPKLIQDDNTGQTPNLTPEIDIDTNRDRARTTSKTGRLGRMANKVTQFGKAALNVAVDRAPVLIGANVADYGLGMLGVGKDSYGKDLVPDTFQDDINWNKMGTGQKIMSSIPRGIESLGNLIGLGNISSQAKAERIKNETQMMNPTQENKPIKLNGEQGVRSLQGSEKDIGRKLQGSENLAPTPDGKYSELSAVRRENETLIEKEKGVINNNRTAPVVINTQNNVGGSRPQPINNTSARPSFNAYERFVNRTFNVL